MSIIASVGRSFEEDAVIAGEFASQEALKNLESESLPDTAIVFASSTFNQEKVINGIKNIIGEKVIVVGCSTAGEITSFGPSNRSVVCMLIKSDSVRFYAGIGENIERSAFDAGKDAAKNVVEKASGAIPKCFIMLSDVLSGNGAEMVRGASSVLGNRCPIVGGAAGDDFQFKKTYQYYDGKVLSGSVVGLGLYGNFRFGIGVRHGWVPIGLPMKVTRSKGANLISLDEKPAISIYEEYFGKEKAKELKTESLAKLAITYPLGVRVEESDELLIRDPITANDDGSITCAAEIPEGSEIRLMMGSKEEAIRVAKLAAENAKAQLRESTPQAVLIFNCIARNKLLGKRAIEEIAVMKDIFGGDVPLTGFYTYGEQAPLSCTGKNHTDYKTRFHNETVVIFAIGNEKDEI